MSAEVQQKRSVLQDLQPCGVMQTGSAWLTAAAATPVSHKLCTASYARTINIYDLQVQAACCVLDTTHVRCKHRSQPNCSASRHREIAYIPKPVLVVGELS